MNFIIKPNLRTPFSHLISLPSKHSGAYYGLSFVALVKYKDIKEINNLYEIIA